MEDTDRDQENCVRKPLNYYCVKHNKKRGQNMEHHKKDSDNAVHCAYDNDDSDNVKEAPKNKQSQ